MADILLSDKRYYGVTHIGTRPTLDNDSFVSIEMVLCQDLVQVKMRFSSS